MDPDALAARRAAAADSLHVSIEEIRHIANATFGDLQDKTQTKAREFSHADVSHSAFTSYPVAQALATQHQAAYSVFNETITGVQRDLERFQTALLDSAKEYENTDDAASTALAAVDRTFDSSQALDTQNAWDGARHDQGSDLETPESSEAGPADGPTDTAPAEADPTTSPNATEPVPTQDEGRSVS
jgi:uncharacterized protein YukE